MRGKFLFVGQEKLYVRGATYGTFRPGDGGDPYCALDLVERDFAQMANHGLNAIRTYTVPPRWLLDLAQQHDLRVMVGLPWEQHITFLDDRQRARDIEARVRAGVRDCAGHPAVLCYAVGNEIPAQILRWHGARRVQSYIERLYQAAKTEDPAGLVTYVNYPTTEYLELPCLDLVAFNVYLETRESLRAYLARLQNLAHDRPLIMAEIGLDSRRNGSGKQAEALDWQIRATFEAGCAGAFVFAWTDEWHRGGYDIEDWDFGLTDRDRDPKPALAAVGRAFAEAPLPVERPWPRVSVVVCSYNGARTIRDTLEALSRLDYPDYEVVVVDDGSTDHTAAIAREYEVRLISTENLGLSSARNTGLAAASGEIVAYLDDDAYPDPHWLKYLADTFLTTDHVGVGGPNLPPPGDELVAECVANAPGGPIHVLLTDEEAEHIPGCNMAFRKSALEAIGGFDPQFRAAGDDVDLCWRLQEGGGRLGFNPAALVWHHRRRTVRGYWKQQQGYGKAEALLERKWPEKYNALGHVSWAGRLYGKELPRALSWRRGRIYQGIWGSAPFQSLYQPGPSLLGTLPLLPEWYLVTGVLAGLTGLGLLWAPLLVALPLLLLALGGSLTQAVLGARRASFSNLARSRLARIERRGLTAALHLLQPLARLSSRLSCGLTPWRARTNGGFALPCPRAAASLMQGWQAREARLTTLEGALRDRGSLVRPSGGFDSWDLEVPGGLLGSAQLLMAVEEHGEGWQRVRLKWWPKWSWPGLGLAALLGALALLAARDQAWIPAAALGLVGLGVGLRMCCEAAAATDAIGRTVRELKLDGSQ